MTKIPKSRIDEWVQKLPAWRRDLSRIKRLIKKTPKRHVWVLDDLYDKRDKLQTVAWGVSAELKQRGIL